MPQISPNILARAEEMRRDGVPWKRIGYDLGVSGFRIRCELEPTYREAFNAKVRQNRGSFVKRAPYVKKSSLPRPVHMGSPPSIPSGITTYSVQVPADVLAERDRIAELQHRDLTAALLGDPLPGRSALDKRKPRMVANNT